MALSSRTWTAVSATAGLVGVVCTGAWAVETRLSQSLRPPDVVAASNPSPVSPEASAPSSRARADPDSGDGSTPARSATLPASVPSVTARPATPPAAERVLVPTRIRVADADVDAPVAPVGVERRGDAMQVPSEPGTVGWYRFGGHPGAARGATVLAGHVTWNRERGAFFGIARLSPGSVVEVDSARGTDRYRVTAVRRLAKDRRLLAEVFDREGPATLRLVTCGGEWDAQQRSYTDNVVVEAVRAG